MGLMFVEFMVYVKFSQDLEHMCTNFINSFPANVTNRGCHSRLPMSPIGDLDHLLNPKITLFTDILLSSRYL